MLELIDLKFKEWTGGKSPVPARISIFENIRNIPYGVLPETTDPITGPEMMLEMNRGSCQPKHYLLGEMLGRLGLNVFYVVYRFHWDEFDGYPDYLKQMARRMPEGRHLSCLVEIEGEYRLVDATADPALVKIGIPINDWDGKSNLSLPFEPLDSGEIYHSSERLPLTPRVFNGQEAAFFKKMNEFLDSLRAS